MWLIASKHENIGWWHSIMEIPTLNILPKKNKKKVVVCAGGEETGGGLLTYYVEALTRGGEDGKT